jgi:hypothetical protein
LLLSATVAQLDGGIAAAIAGMSPPFSEYPNFSVWRELAVLLERDKGQIRGAGIVEGDRQIERQWT